MKIIKDEKLITLNPLSLDEAMSGAMEVKIDKKKKHKKLIKKIKSKIDRNL